MPGSGDSFLLLQLARKERELAAVRRITDALHARIRVEDLVRQTLDTAIEVVEASAGSILLHDPERDCLVFRYVVGASPEITRRLEGQEMPTDRGLAGSVFQSGMGIITPDASLEARHYREIDEVTRYTTRSMITVPLTTTGGRVIGVMETLNRRSGEFDEADLAVLEVLSGQAASVLETTRLHERLLNAEAEKQRFLREVIRCVTRGRLELVDAVDLGPAGVPLFETSFDTPDGYSALREQLGALGRDAGMEPDAVDDLVLAAGEAATNAIKHGGGGHAAVYRTDDRLVVRVTDRGPGIRPEDLPASVLLPGHSTKASLGMGFTLMLELVDRIRLATGPEGTVLQLEKSVLPAQPAQSPVEALLARFSASTRPTD